MQQYYTTHVFYVSCLKRPLFHGGSHEVDGKPAVASSVDLTALRAAHGMFRKDVLITTCKTLGCDNGVMAFLTSVPLISINCAFLGKN